MKRVKIGFTESSKAVTADIDVEYSGEEIPDKDEILREAQELYTKAELFSKNRSINKL
jgi:hypothetical protein